GSAPSAPRRPSASASTSCSRASARRPSRTSRSRSTSTASSHPASTKRSPSPTERVRVGICSWADPALIESGGFYPKRSMSAEARLRYYASVFDTVEVNSSYYAIPDIKNTVRWVERTPLGFVFHVKAYALLTGHHPKPESLPAELQALLPRQPGRTRRGEIEAASFPPEAVDAAFRLFRAAVTPLADAGCRLQRRNADGWLRQLRGEEPAVREKYDYLYSEAELRELLPEIGRIGEEAEQVFISFNNNNRDDPVQNARMMKRLLGQPVGEPRAPADSLPGDLFA